MKQIRLVKVKVISDGQSISIAVDINEVKRVFCWTKELVNFATEQIGRGMPASSFEVSVED